MQEQIIDLKLIKPPLSSGQFSLGVSIKTKSGIIQWDASPIGTTTSHLDPSLVDFPEAHKQFEILKKRIKGHSVLNQIEIDDIIVQTLGIVNSGLYGANLGISLSCAVARAGANYKQKPLFVYLADLYGTSPKVPMIMCNLLGGGRHHSNKMQTTELMVISAIKSKLPFEQILAIWHNLQQRLNERDEPNIVGLEGCIVPTNLTDEKAIAMLLAEIKQVCSSEMTIGLDMAGIKSYPYHFVEDMIEQNPEIQYVEDPYPINNKKDYVHLLKRFPSKLIAGDDITVGKKEVISEHLANGVVNTIVFKINHVGTITRLVDSLRTSQSYGAVTVCSQRSQETARNTLAHLAIAFAFDYIKNGAPVRERVANYSTLSAINSFLK